MDARLSSYDWGKAFECCGREPTSEDWTRDNEPEVNAVPGFTGSVDGFTREEVVEIIALVDGEHDDSDWLGVFRLADGRFACLRAGCDYTGWGCRSGGSANVAATLEDIIRFGLGDMERERLGLRGAA